MIQTNVIYNIVIRHLVACENQLKAYESMAKKIPERAYRGNNDYPSYGEDRKKARIHEMADVRENGDAVMHEILRKATPFAQLHGNAWRGKLIEFTDHIDKHVKDDVEKAMIAGVVGEPVKRPFMTFPLSDLPVGGYEKAKQAIDEAFSVVAMEREALRNLARTLKVAINPEIAPYGDQGPAACIDVVAVDKSLIEQRRWIEAADIVSKAMQPVSVDEHVVDTYFKRESVKQPDFSTGYALLKFGDNPYGQANKIVYGIWERQAYGQRITLYPDVNEAHCKYHDITSESDDGNKLKKVRHTNEGNFVGGCFTDESSHPKFSEKAAKQPWSLGLHDQRGLVRAVAECLRLCDRPKSGKVPNAFVLPKVGG